MYGPFRGPPPSLKKKERMLHMANQKKPNTVAVATALAKPLADAMGLTLWDVRFEKEGSLWYLRYLIDKEGGVNIQECEDLSRAISKALDEQDPIDQSYYLEVGSPGVERELVQDWHYARYLGSQVNVRLIRPVEGIRDFTGTLEALEGETVTLLLEEDLEMNFLRGEAAYVRLVDDYDYENAQLPQGEETESEEEA